MIGSLSILFKESITCLYRCLLEKKYKKMVVCIKKNDIDHGINSLNLIIIIRFKELIP